MLVMLSRWWDRRCNCGRGRGSQVASFLAYTAIFGVESEPAAAASIVLWLVTFAACSWQACRY